MWEPSGIVACVVGTDLPATGHTAWIAVFGALFTAAGLLLVGSTRRTFV